MAHDPYKYFRIEVLELLEGLSPVLSLPSILRSLAAPTAPKEATP